MIVNQEGNTYSIKYGKHHEQELLPLHILNCLIKQHIHRSDSAYSCMHSL